MNKYHRPHTLHAALWCLNTKINVASIEKSAHIICRLCTLSGAFEVEHVAADQSVASMSDVVAPPLSMNEEAVLLWGEVTLSSEPKVTLELAATELNPAVAMTAVAVSPPVSALPSPSALPACSPLFSTLAASVLNCCIFAAIRIMEPTGDVQSVHRVWRL
jgi:hypothetical protein